ncbi:hypothetical protein ACLOJK_039685 [Asimina triloba]
MDRTTSNLRRFHALLLLLLTFPVSRSLGVVDSITQGQSMTDGETLVSAGGVFELGFFSPNGTNDRYLGIWYRQITKENVVWVANREDPLTNTTGALTIDETGNLVILNERGAVVHSLYISISQANSSSAVLLDSGNFVLMNETRGVVWQSFDDPTDTYLAGMKLGLDIRTGKKWALTSWTSSRDPAPGSYSVGLDPNEPRRLIIQRKDGSITWNSGLWNGEIFSLVPEMRSMFKYTLVASGDVYYFFFSLYNSSTLPKLVMDAHGQLKLLTWSEESKSWYSFWAQPRDECELYNSCGANARCNISAANRCNCLDGFDGDLSRHQQSSLWERRCVRRKNITCTDDGDDFLKIERVRFPDQSWYEGNKSMSTEECEIGCRRNCSCSAYASAYSNGTGGCLFWADDLIGLRDSPPYADYNGFAMGNIFVRVAASDGGQVESRKGLLPLELSTDLSAAKEFVQASNLGHGGRSRDLLFFSFAVVETATDNFSHENMLGQGGFGHVYKGKLADGQEIAVKRLSRSSGQGLEEFKNEVMLDHSGYMSPEYGMEGIFSVKSDVFSFGVILLEIVTGKKNAAARYLDGSVNLLGYVKNDAMVSTKPCAVTSSSAWELWKDGRISELIDPMLVDSAPAQELARYVHVAFLCVQNSPMYRPTMPDVVHMLTNKAATLNMPKQPAFSIQREAEADGSSSKPTTCSVNAITVSEVNEGR